MTTTPVTPIEPPTSAAITPIDASRYRRIIVLTGAGVSVASGLRPYRGPGGLWQDADVEALAHAGSLERDPARTWQLFGSQRVAAAGAEPNAAHRVLAAWEAALKPDQQFLLVTQNVDGLHQRAGSRNVIEFHGNVLRTRCSDPRCASTPFRDLSPHAEAVPRCPVCGANQRADVVMFGEAIPPEAEWTVKRALRDCDLFIAIGTSGLVTPAANFVRGAAYAGARTVLVNLEPMVPRNPAFQEELLGPAETVLPVLLGVSG